MDHRDIAAEAVALRHRLEQRAAALPRVVYRIIDTEEHVNDLLTGRVWLGTLRYYRTIEDEARRDPGDGSMSYHRTFDQGGGDEPDFVTRAKRSGIGVGEGARNVTIANETSTRVIRDAWILCTTMSDSEAVRKFGPFCVAISNPQAFHNRLLIAVNAQAPLQFDDFRQVTYDERLYSDDEAEPGRIGFVKPKHPFAEEQEFRFLYLPRRQPATTGHLFNCPAIVDLVRRVR